MQITVTSECCIMSHARGIKYNIRRVEVVMSIEMFLCNLLSFSLEMYGGDGSVGHIERIQCCLH